MDNYSKYKALNKQIYIAGKYSIVPIRMEDRYLIMQWRNEQIYHLRQSKPLTKEDQDYYFEHVVAKLFDQEKPNQILFSFLKGDQCIGYGGLVHINWIDQNAEISFVIDTLHENDYFEFYWIKFLALLKFVTFNDLQLHKIYTYAFDIRPKIYSALEKAGFKEDARLKNHCLINGNYIDVIMHYFLNPRQNLGFRRANYTDAKILYDWANDEAVRSNAFSSSFIEWDAHTQWLKTKLKSAESAIYIFYSHLAPIGQVRIDLQKDGKWKIDYSVDENFRGLGLGKLFIETLLTAETNKIFSAQVKKENIASIKVFEKLNFTFTNRQNSDSDIIEFIHQS